MTLLQTASLSRLHFPHLILNKSEMTGFARKAY